MVSHPSCVSRAVAQGWRCSGPSVTLTHSEAAAPSAKGTAPQQSPLVYLTKLRVLLTNTQKPRCVCLKTILPQLNITIKVTIFPGKWFTAETICNSALQSLHKKCTHSHASCGNNSGERRNYYETEIPWIQGARANRNMQICSRHRWNKNIGFTKY